MGVIFLFASNLFIWYKELMNSFNSYQFQSAHFVGKMLGGILPLYPDMTYLNS
jgi:hypothetical protein